MSHPIHVGQWLFYPQHMAARNVHNGSVAYFSEDANGGWRVSAVNCPAQWMLKEIADWFGKWITGSFPSEERS